MQAAPYETTVSMPPQDVEAYLKESIRVALQESCAKDCSHQEAIERLDRAWELQKLLWRMRRGEVPVSVQLQISVTIDPQFVLPLGDRAS